MTKIRSQWFMITFMSCSTITIVLPCRSSRWLWSSRCWRRLRLTPAAAVVCRVEQLAAVGRREPGEQVEGRRLARPVGADEAGDLAPGDGEAASVHGPDPAEGLSEITRLQGDPVRARAHQWIIPLRTQPRSMANPMRPRGMKRATRTMKRPYAIRCAVGKLTQVSSWTV